MLYILWLQVSDGVEGKSWFLNGDALNGCLLILLIGVVYLSNRFTEIFFMSFVLLFPVYFSIMYLD
jgi:hypothetical protein